MAAAWREGRGGRGAGICRTEEAESEDLVRGGVGGEGRGGGEDGSQGPAWQLGEWRSPRWHGRDCRRTHNGTAVG